MSKYIIMIGTPGSGKSTAAEKLSKIYNARIFSSDSYRKKLLGTDTDQSQNAYIFECLYKDLRQHLKDGGSAILDATNMTCKGRRQSLEAAKGINCERLAYVMNTPISDCIKRDKGRARTVGEDVVWKFIKRFEFPTLYEGFDTIILDNESGYHVGAGFENAEDKMINFNQNNHHHTMTLDKHTMAVMNNYDVADYGYWAAKYHDVGKIYIEAKDESGESHYYNHANVSAYWLTSHICELPQAMFSRRFDIIRLINYHMKANDIFKSEKSIKKHKNILGTELLNKLKLFNINDMNSK